MPSCILLSLDICHTLGLKQKSALEGMGMYVCFVVTFLKKDFFLFSPYSSSAIIGKGVFEGYTNGATRCFEQEWLLISNIILQGNHTAMARPISLHPLESTFSASESIANMKNIH